jgi:hypothetical protein
MRGAAGRGANGGRDGRAPEAHDEGYSHSGTNLELLHAMASDFLKRLDDTVRQELTVMGHDYRAIVRTIEEAGAGGVVVRLHEPYEDVGFEEADGDLPGDVLAARIARRLKVAIEAPERTPNEEPSEAE